MAEIVWWVVEAGTVEVEEISWVAFEGEQCQGTRAGRIWEVSDTMSCVVFSRVATKVFALIVGIDVVRLSSA